MDPSVNIRNTGYDYHRPSIEYLASKEPKPLLINIQPYWKEVLQEKGYN
jgi:hypothetical protein